jgi:hypothetical protein
MESTASATAPLRVLGLGDPIIDVIVNIDDAFVASTVGEAGGCLPVPDAASMAALLSAAAAAAPSGLLRCACCARLSV